MAVCFENRDLFVTKKAYHSFSGYAHDQFKKMISFNQEAQALMRDLERQLLEFDIEPESTTDGHALKTTSGQAFIGATTEMMEVVKRYKGERRRYYSGGYISKKRRELVMRVGYDSKNAAHLIRLLRMGIEFLTEGTGMSNAPTVLSCCRSTVENGRWKSESRSREIISIGVIAGYPGLDVD